MTRLTLLAGFVLVSAMAHAQTPRPASPPQIDSRGTPEDQQACDRDAQRHCRAVLSQGDFAVLACLQENRPKITRACDAVLKRYGQ